MMDYPHNKQESRPQWLASMAADKIHEIDVRPVISSGTDPLKMIMEKFRSLHDGEVLCIVNSFTPYPLINMLANQSLAYTEDARAGEIHTWFLKRPQARSAASHPAGPGVRMDSAETFAAAVSAFLEEQIRRIDVRALPAPGPMQAILRELASLPAGQALYVYHKKVPVYLLEEIQDQHYAVHILDHDHGDVRVLIHANDRPDE